MLTQLIDSFPTTYGPRSCDKEKLSIPLEPHDKAQSSTNIVFGQKLGKAVFLSFGQSCRNCTFKLLRSRAFQRRMAYPIARKKSGSSHVFGVLPSRAAQTAFVPELSKAITFLSYIVSWRTCTFKLG